MKLYNFILKLVSDWINSASYYNTTDSGGECGILATRLYPQPVCVEQDPTNEPWWSYDIGLIHMIGLSTEHNYTIGSIQYKWLESDLKLVDRKKTPWIIFGAHRAMYLNSNYGGSETSDLVVMDLMIKNLEPILYKYSVDVGFYGHNHVVQRQSSVFNYTVLQHPIKSINPETGQPVYIHQNPPGPIHMVIGTAGASFTKNAVSTKPEWNEYYFYKWGYGIFTAYNESLLEYKWIESETNKLYDNLFIYK